MLWALLVPFSLSLPGALAQLSAPPPAAGPATPAVESLPAAEVRQREQQRFARLERRGVIALRWEGGRLRLTMNPLLWQRLSPAQQLNLLRRAQLAFAASAAVELVSAWNQQVLARLTPEGVLEVPPEAFR
ncbi:MAG: hypothetical protein KatS3mg131_1828 [Candidatus Tectimicrobiota bacterium]|nr:MAG: hypothetical protein KatS3mg131_1828 [Candidatus Tectomicrobia bacterium]